MTAVLRARISAPDRRGVKAVRQAKRVAAAATGALWRGCGLGASTNLAAAREDLILEDDGGSSKQGEVQEH